MSSAAATKGEAGRICGSTDNAIMAADITDLATDRIGTTVSKYQGAEAVAAVEKDPTNMSAYYQQTSELYDKQAVINSAQSAVDAGLSILAMTRKSIHSKYEETFKNAAATKLDSTNSYYNGSGNGAEKAREIGGNTDLALRSGALADQAKENERIATNQANAAAVKSLAGAAASEQESYATKAMGRFMKSALRAGEQIALAVTNADQAANMRKERDKYCANGMSKKSDGSCPTEPDPGSGDTGPDGELITNPNGTSNGDTRAPGGGIMPDGNMSVSKAVADDSEHKTDGAPAGGGVKEIDTPQGAKASGPEAGTFKEGNGGAPAGGGGGGSANVAGTGAASEVSGGEPGSTSMAAEAKGGGYEAGEGGGRYGGGGTPGSANIGGGMPDVNELLAGLLPKKEDGPGNGIVQFAERGLASAPGSLLDAKTNIFERLHTTYLDKHKRGVVGIK